MSVRIGVMSSAHMHCWGYAAALKRSQTASLTGIWDPDDGRARAFERNFETRAFSSQEELFDACDAVVVTSENTLHAEYVESAARAGKHVLCEKPLVTSIEEKDLMFAALESSGIQLMTAFPCRYSPAFQRLKQRVDAGEIGEIVGISATNRGRCPGGWFIDTSLSGGGAMIDHVVHVADLLRVLLNMEVQSVHAYTGNNMYGQAWEDTAMLTLDFGNGLFATLDSSWSRPKDYKTWGDVTMTVVGTKGVIELSLFGQQLDIYGSGTPSHTLAGFGSDMDAALIEDFAKCVQDRAPVTISAMDGWKACQVALSAYASSRTGSVAIVN